MHSETPCIMGLYMHNQLHAVQVKPLTKNINGIVVEMPTYSLPGVQSSNPVRPKLL